MAKTPHDPAIDVLVLGGHPAAYLAAALLRHKAKLRILHACIPEEELGDRLVMINPALFTLHPLLEGLKRKIGLSGIYGLRFLADEPPTASEYRSKPAAGCIASLKDVKAAMEALAEREGVELLRSRSLTFHRVDEHGMDVSLGNHAYRATALVAAGRLSAQQEKMLGIPDEWERGVLRRYCFVRVKGTKNLELGAKPLMPMSLDLKGSLIWAWLLPGDRHVQLAVEQPLDASAAGQHKPADLLRHWATVLLKHGALNAPLEFADDQVQTLLLPFAGALAHEGVANRTLLVGPAGGFYTACGEDVYPNCWSAIYAAEIMKKSLKEPHLQDALQAYRQRWRTTLGDYLRGPQMDLRFLLTLVYRNQNMTDRLAEAILTGRSIMR
jgi:flavin-dependent dehydrogenase